MWHSIFIAICYTEKSIHVYQERNNMANNVKNQTRPRWTHSEIASLTLWYNQGVPMNEIAQRLNRTVGSISGVLNNRRGTLGIAPAYNRHKPVEHQSNRVLVFHLIETIDSMVIMKSIIQIANDYFQARLFFIKSDLTWSKNVQMAEFQTVESCHRWFLSVIDQLPQN